MNDKITPVYSYGNATCSLTLLNHPDKSKARLILSIEGPLQHWEDGWGRDHSGPPTAVKLDRLSALKLANELITIAEKDLK